MRFGILEDRNDQFARDVAEKLSDLSPEFLRLGELNSPAKMDVQVILDRLSFQNIFLREAVKSFALNGTYVINNPFTSQIYNKSVDMDVSHSLGIPRPKTVILPMPDDDPDDHTMKEPDVEAVLRTIDFPCVLKPYDGYAWENVYHVTSRSEFINLYDAMKFRRVMLAQEYIERRHYYKVFCVNKKDVLFVEYVPKPFGQGLYLESSLAPIEGLVEKIRNWTIQLNKALDLDFNTLEWSITSDGDPYLIDAYNEVPEVLKNGMPPNHYWWIVNKVCECVREKLDKGEKNRNPFA
jgi:hypothetical protein